MNLKQSFLLILFIGVGVFSLLAFGNDEIAHPVLKSNSVSRLDDSPKIIFESKIDDQALVTVTVIPIDISLQSKEWKFNVSLSTHAVELDQDMVKISVLVDDKGKEYKPIRWEGAPPGGHHREGVLVFNQITPIPKFVGLKISGIGDVVRSFTWED